jgi:hypothetical protein
MRHASLKHALENATHRDQMFVSTTEKPDNYSVITHVRTTQNAEQIVYLATFTTQTHLPNVIDSAMDF